MCVSLPFLFLPAGRWSLLRDLTPEVRPVLRTVRQQSGAAGPVPGAAPRCRPLSLFLSDRMDLRLGTTAGCDRSDVQSSVGPRRGWLLNVSNCGEVGVGVLVAAPPASTGQLHATSAVWVAANSLKTEGWALTGWCELAPAHGGPGVQGQ